MIRAGIIGATGYAGNELVRLLLQHKEAEVVWYGSKSYIDKKYASVYQNMFQLVDDVCMDDNMQELAEAVDVIFTATTAGALCIFGDRRDFVQSKSYRSERRFSHKGCKGFMRNGMG